MMDYATHPGVKAKASPLPRHVAIIMDGNGRWAASRKLSHTSGHRKGVEVARDVIFACQDRGIEALTFLLLELKIGNVRLKKSEIYFGSFLSY